MISLIDDEADTEIGRHNNKGLRFYGFYFSLVDWNAASHFLCIHVHHFGSGFAEFFTNKVKIICVKKKKKKNPDSSSRETESNFFPNSAFGSETKRVRKWLHNKLCGWYETNSEECWGTVGCDTFSRVHPSKYKTHWLCCPKKKKLPWSSAD